MRVLIYGMGGMGGFFKNFFHARGYSVTGYDIDKEKSDVNSINIEEFNVIFLSVPMDAVEDCLEELNDLFKSNLSRLKGGNGVLEDNKQIKGQTTESKMLKPLLVDISSIKEKILPLLDTSVFDYLSIHPMFGPQSEIGLSNIIIIHKSGRDEEKILLNEFKKAGAVLSHLTPEEHDKKMAEIQGIAHFTLLGIADFLNNKFDKKDMVYASPIFAVLYKLASRILHQDWKMYFQIQKNAEGLRKDFLKKLETFEKKMGAEKEFSETFERLRGSSFTDFESSTLILDAFKATEDVEDINLLRGYIMAIDSLILRLIERRTEAGKKIALHKIERNEPIELLDVEGVKIKDILNKTNLSPIYIQNIFEDIMQLTKEVEYHVLGISKTLSVLGPQGSYSEDAALKLVGSRLPLKYCSTTDQIIRNVEEGVSDYGLVPIENSINGTVLPVLDALLKSNVEVFGETSLEINHCMAARRKIPFKEVKAIYSHPQAIAQSMGFINNYMPQAEIRYTSSTSDAVTLLDDNSTAILSENAAKIHRLFILKKRIQDVGGKNETRFYIIRKRGIEKLKGRITSLFFGVQDRPGSLKDTLEIFYKRNINMRKLESRPARTGLGDYIFFVELEKELSEEELSDLRSVTTFCHIIGVFDNMEKIDLWM